MTKESLLEQISLDLKAVTGKLEEFRKLNSIEYLFRVSEKSWNVVEVIDHMSRFYNFYLPQIEERIERFKGVENDKFYPGIFGNYMVKNLRPQKTKIKFKMKTFSKMDSFGASDQEGLSLAIETHLKHLESLKNTLVHFPKLDLNKPRIISAAGPILKFKLGDAYRILLAHDIRHLQQCENILNTFRSQQS
ncbi:MAG: DinB family protein [Flavobacteriales bacterium]|nr:DinB family protein [Flavobacteriales bacterium]